MAFDGDTLVVCSDLEDSDGIGVDPNQNNESSTDSGASYVFVREGESWPQRTFLKPLVNSPGAHFGMSAALQGSWLVVGAHESSKVGAVFPFEYTTKWIDRPELKASNADHADKFGRFVAVQGQTLVVTAYFEDSSATGVDGDQLNNVASDSGAAYVFELEEGGWQQSAYLKASNTGNSDWFGGALAFDGKAIAISSRKEDSADTGVFGVGEDEDSPDSGAVYVFERYEDSWAQTAYLKASNTGSGDEFGSSVAIDGDTLAVGSRLEDSDATGTEGDQADDTAKDAGAVYVFVRSDGGWAQQAYLKASNTDNGDQFGTRVALSGDFLAVSATGEASDGSSPDDDSLDDAGAVYLFRRTGTAWAQIDYFKAPEPRDLEFFGLDLVMNHETLAVGARGEGTGNDGAEALNSGAVFVFR
jgi:hypothetical protein